MMQWMDSWCTHLMVKPENMLIGASLVFNGIKEHTSWVMYMRIQFIQVTYCSLFLLACDTHDLQLVTEDVYEARVHVFIYSHT
jgi:hypothetical protein